MKRFKQISYDPEPSVLGVSNGLCQVEFKEKKLRKNENFQEIDEILLTFDLGNQEKVPKLLIKNLEGTLLKKAKLTDLMVFSPHFLGCKYLVNQKVIDCFHSTGVNREEYRLIKTTIEKTNYDYFLLFVPSIPTLEIDFAKTKIFQEKEYLSESRSYFEVTNYTEYRDLLDDNPFVSFEKICLPKKYQDQNILSVQGAVDLFFSKGLISSLEEAEVSNFRIPNRQIDLVFSE